MTFDDKLKELDIIEERLPKKYSELINNIDMYIFGCEQGLTKSLELCIIASHEYALAENAYKKQFAIIFLENNGKMPVTILKDFTKSKCYAEAETLTLKEAQKQVAEYHKNKWDEKLQVYKKIKAVRF